MKDNKKEFLLKSATYLSVTTASIILILKIFAWYKTNSSSILASLVDSGLDITTSLINVIAIRYAIAPPDHNHRFGHDKFEDLAVFGQGIIFILSSLVVVISSFYNLFYLKEVTEAEFGIKVMIISTIMTGILVSYQYYVHKQTNSSVIEADKLHYFTDFLTNIAVIISIILSEYLFFVDSLLGVLIALYLCYGAYSLIIKSFKNLVDEEFDEEDKNKVLNLLKEYIKQGKIHSIHDFKTRKAANKRFIQFHMEIDGKLSLNKVHNVTEEIEQKIDSLFPEVEIIIHQDPIGIDEDIMFESDINVK